MTERLYLIDEETNNKVWNIIKSYIPEKVIEIDREEIGMLQDLKLNPDEHHIPARLVKKDKLALHDMILSAKGKYSGRNIINDTRICIFNESDRFNIDDITIIGVVIITTIKLNKDKIKVFIPLGLTDDSDNLYIGTYVGYDNILREEFERIIDCNSMLLTIGINLLNFWYSLQIILSKTDRYLADKDSSNQTIKYRVGNNHKVYMAERCLLHLLPIIEELGYKSSEKRFKEYIGYWKVYSDNTISFDIDKFYEKVPILKQFRKLN